METKYFIKESSGELRIITQEEYKKTANGRVIISTEGIRIEEYSKALPDKILESMNRENEQVQEMKREFSEDFRKGYANAISDLNITINQVI